MPEAFNYPKKTLIVNEVSDVDCALQNPNSSCFERIDARLEFYDEFPLVWGF